MVPMGQRLWNADDVRCPEAAGGLHPARRRGADVLGRDAIGRRARRLAQRLRAAAGHRGLALRRQPDRLCAADCQLGAWPGGWPPRTSSPPSASHRHPRLPPEGRGLRGGPRARGAAVALAASREEFDRKSALFEIPFSTRWIMSTAAVVAASIGLGLFAFRHVEYSHELWWTFDVDAGCAALPARHRRRPRRHAVLRRPSAVAAAAARSSRCPAADELDAAARVIARTARARCRTSSSSATRRCSGTRRAPRS